MIQTYTRIKTIDALRGMALFGILLAHMSFWFNAGSLPNKVWEQFSHDTSFQVISTFDQIFVTGKFYTFFSFLFGLSFGIQMMTSKEKSFSLKFAWRLIILFIIGAIHHLHWKGDILGIYAVLGFVLLLCKNLSPKALAVISILLMLNTPGRLIEAFQSKPPQKTEAQQKAEEAKWTHESEEYYRIMTEGSYAEIIKRNIVGFKEKAVIQWESGRIWITLGFFFLGLWVQKLRIFEQLDANKNKLKKIIKYGIIYIVSVIVLVVVLQTTLGNNHPLPGYVQYGLGVLFNTFDICMTFVYICGFSLLFSKSSLQKVTDTLANVGQMGLTNYLLQTFIGSFLFFSWGLGLMGKTHPATNYSLAFLIFILQIIISNLWLSKFKQGPVEWLWRSLTKMTWQKNLK